MQNFAGSAADRKNVAPENLPKHKIDNGRSLFLKFITFEQNKF